MKICTDCNLEMIPAKLNGQPFDLTDIEKEINSFSLRCIKGKKEVSSFFGGTKIVDDYVEHDLKSRVCLNCGKVEFYVDIIDKN